MAEERSRMPVVSLARTKLENCFPRMSLEKIIENLPFIGLDIEGIDDRTIRVEYNPNRPDYSSDYGIIRSLKGLLGIELGIPTLNLSGRSGVAIKVDPKVRQLRPIISALVATGGMLDSDDVKQLITMQEDLHNGLGRKRKKASIGIHNLDSIQPPIRYTTVTSDYSFTPLGEAHTLTISEVLEQTEPGKAYAELTAGWPGLFPAILDSRGTLLSFPPIINGKITKMAAGTD